MQGRLVMMTGIIPWSYELHWACSCHLTETNKQTKIASIQRFLFRSCSPPCLCNCSNSFRSVVQFCPPVVTFRSFPWLCFRFPQTCFDKSLLNDSIQVGFVQRIQEDRYVDFHTFPPMFGTISLPCHYFHLHPNSCTGKLFVLFFKKMAVNIYKLPVKKKKRKRKLAHPQEFGEGIVGGREKNEEKSLVEVHFYSPCQWDRIGELCPPIHVEVTMETKKKQKQNREAPAFLYPHFFQSDSRAALSEK